MSLVTEHSDGFSVNHADLNGQTMDDGHGVWTKTSGTWQSSGGTATGAGDEFLYDSAGADVDEQQTTCTFPTSVLGGYVCIRMQFGRACYGFGIFPGGGALLRFASDGGFTVLASGLGTISSGSTLKLYGLGSALDCYINGSLVHSATDSTYTTGTRGLRCSGSQSDYDDWLGEIGGTSARPFSYAVIIA